MNRETYERMVKNSTTGQRQSSKPVRKKQVPKKKVKLSKVGLCLAVALITTISVNGINAIKTRIGENFEVMQSINEFHREVITDNTHRTQDGQHYWYDYYEIGKSIKGDEDVYKLVQDIGQYQANRVLETRSDIEDTVEDYIKNRNYKDMKDFRETNHKRILIQNDIEESQQELREMQHDLETSTAKAETQTQELGGK